MTRAPCLATDMAAHIILWQGTFMGSWPCLAAVIFIDDCTSISTTSKSEYTDSQRGGGGPKGNGRGVDK